MTRSTNHLAPLLGALALGLAGCSPARGAPPAAAATASSAAAPSSAGAVGASSPVRGELLAVEAAGLWPVDCAPGQELDPSLDTLPEPDEGAVEQRCFELGLVTHRRGSDGDGGPRREALALPLDRRLRERLFERYDDDALVVMRVLLEAIERAGPLQLELLARPTRRGLRLLALRLPHRVRPHVQLSLPVERCVARLAARFYRRKGRALTITSGIRTPWKQARAMYHKLSIGARYRRLYKKKELAEEIRQTFRRGRRARLRRGAIVAKMAEVIRTQMARGNFISEHLRMGAVDLRSRNLRFGHKVVLESTVRQLRGLKLNREERRPPHYHMEVDGADPRCGEPKRDKHRR
jgi:hypothetical protein